MKLTHLKYLWTNQNSSLSEPIECQFFWQVLRMRRIKYRHSISDVATETSLVDSVALNFLLNYPLSINAWKKCVSHLSRKLVLPTATIPVQYHIISQTFFLISHQIFFSYVCNFVFLIILSTFTNNTFGQTK